MSEIATLRFRAKRQDGVTRWHDNPAGGSTLTEGHTAYAVPKLTSAHVITPRPDQGARHVLMFAGSTTDAIRKSRTESLLRAHGLDAYHVFVEDAETHPGIVTIEHDKGGFMATITLTLDLAGRGAP